MIVCYEGIPWEWLFGGSLFKGILLYLVFPTHE